MVFTPPRCLCHRHIRMGWNCPTQLHPLLLCLSSQHPTLVGRKFPNTFLFSSRLLTESMSSCQALSTPLLSLSLSLESNPSFKLRLCIGLGRTAVAAPESIEKLKSCPFPSWGQPSSWKGARQYVLEPFTHQLCYVIDQEGQPCLLSHKTHRRLSRCQLSVL